MQAEGAAASRAMFVLATLKDKVKVEPEFFQDDMSIPVIAEIQRRYSNKVIAEVGLCICVHQVLEMGDMYIYANEGAAYIVTIFHMVVFRPFTDEVLSGTIHSISATGMKVSVGFYDEIFVPAHRLPAPHEYDAGDTEDGEPGPEAERKWVWVTEDGARLDMEVGDEVRVKVRDVEYHETRKDKYPMVSYDQDGGASRLSLPSPSCLPFTPYVPVFPAFVFCLLAHPLATRSLRSGRVVLPAAPFARLPLDGTLMRGI